MGFITPSTEIKQENIQVVRLVGGSAGTGSVKTPLILVMSSLSVSQHYTGHIFYILT